MRTAELVEMQKILDEPQLKLQWPTETRWLSHQNGLVCRWLRKAHLVQFVIQRLIVWVITSLPVEAMET